MGYTAVRGGLEAIRAAEALVAGMLLGSETALRPEQVSRHLQLALAKVLAEGGVYDEELGALALRQAEGDAIEAAFLLRAYRSTLPRLGYSNAVSGREMRVLRRVSSVFKDIPGGQLLGLTRDYTQRLLDFGPADGAAPDLGDAPPFTRADESGRAATAVAPGSSSPARADASADEARGSEDDPGDDPEPFPSVIDFLQAEGLMAEAPTAPREDEPFDVTRTPPQFPIPRSGWLQVLARGEAGAMLMLAYSSMRGFGGQGHGALAELRAGELPVRITHPLTGRPVTIGQVPVTEVHYISGGHGSLQDADGGEGDYRMGYGLVSGRDERKAIAMAIVDASLRFAEPEDRGPVANQEFVVYHVDAVESAGFVEHLKLPHYVTFQAGVQRSRRFRELVEASSRG